MRTTLILLLAAALFVTAAPIVSAEGPTICETRTVGDITYVRCGAVCVWYSPEGTSGGGCA